MQVRLNANMMLCYVCMCVCNECDSPVVMRALTVVAESVLTVLSFRFMPRNANRVTNARSSRITITIAATLIADFLVHLYEHSF